MKNGRKQQERQREKPAAARRCGTHPAALLSVLFSPVLSHCGKADAQCAVKHFLFPFRGRKWAEGDIEKKEGQTDRDREKQRQRRETKAETDRQADRCRQTDKRFKSIT